MFDPKPHFWICLGVHLRIFQLELAGRDNVGHGEHTSWHETSFEKMPITIIRQEV